MKNKEAIKIVGKYTVAASITGGIPVPASSAAIIGENAIMVNHIGSIYGVKITSWSILRTFGLLGTLNIIGRNVFMEGAKLLSWGTGSVWAAPGLCLLGATTAGLQTYLIGILAIEIAKQGGSVIDFEKSSEIVKKGKVEYKDFLKEFKEKNLHSHRQN
jgi:uncharacterized protein (DUF697 family)